MPQALLSWFSNDPAVWELGVPYLRVLALTLPFTALEIATAEAVMGSGHTAVLSWIYHASSRSRASRWRSWCRAWTHSGVIGIAWLITLSCMLRTFVVLAVGVARHVEARARRASCTGTSPERRKCPTARARLSLGTPCNGAARRSRAEPGLVHPQRPSNAARMTAMHYRYVIIGGGTAAAAAIEGIRAHDADGGILLISRENHLPYRRTPLTKDVWRAGYDLEGLSLHPAAFYDAHRVEMRLRREIVEMDAEHKLLWDERGESVGFDQLLICTGCRPRRLHAAGAETSGVRYYRDLEDLPRSRAAAASASSTSRSWAATSPRSRWRPRCARAATR